MSVPARVPRRLATLPFRGGRAVSEGLLTWTMLRGPTWIRLLPDVYVHRDGHRADDHRMWCEAVTLRLPPDAVLAGRSAAWVYGVDVLTRDAPSQAGLANLLAAVGGRVDDVVSSEFVKAGYDPAAAPLYAQALIGTVTFVGQWWVENPEMSAEEAASHLAALAWMGLRRLPRRPQLGKGR